jgi:hypothetical protein
MVRGLVASEKWLHPSRHEVIRRFSFSHLSAKSVLIVQLSFAGQRRTGPALELGFQP